jgi:hypothetical protein
LVVSAGSRLLRGGWLRRYFLAVPKAINKPKTSFVGVGLVKPVAGYGAKSLKHCAITALRSPELVLVKNQPSLSLKEP